AGCNPCRVQPLPGATPAGRNPCRAQPLRAQPLQGATPAGCNLSSCAFPGDPEDGDLVKAVS
ncbi:hypothetical protein NRY68_08175, partial [Acidithiobacillus ferrooxidans]|uniref:hypothetical protein n=1 Tax=Acidithiobacillus ferrooxidans TaxID=920 RepID=UPI002147EC68